MVLSCSAVRAVCQISNGVLIMIFHQVHFIWWIKKLRQQVCYEIPEHSFKCSTNIVTEKQDVVCVNVLPDAAENITLFAEANDTQMAPIMFKYKNASITLQDDFNEHTLKRLLTVLQEVSC